MSTLNQLTSQDQKIHYSKGWAYQNQLGKLQTEAPHILPKRESWPAGVDNLREQEITRAGFIAEGDHRASYLYRAHPAPTWIKDSPQWLDPKTIAPHWVTGLQTPPPEKIACLPRAYLDQKTPTTGDTIQNLKTLFYNTQVSMGYSKSVIPMDYFLRNVDGDDLFFVHKGKGVIETELGVLEYHEGHYVWIPRGIAYRIVPRSETHELFHFENYGEKFCKPPTGFTGDAAVYYHRNIDSPTACYSLEKGEYRVVVKSHGNFTEYLYPFHPCDVVGWDGDLYPIRLHILDIHPITSWRAHIPPSAYCTFFGEGFEVCSFVPRPVETGERALPVPWDHINVERDEVIFYSKGKFFSKKESPEGWFTFHPRGPSHGPHPDSLERAEKKRAEEGAFIHKGYFILIETSLKLFPTEFSKTIENPDYINSWQ